jgi:hypothetical protein
MPETDLTLSPDIARTMPGRPTPRPRALFRKALGAVAIGAARRQSVELTIAERFRGDEHVQRAAEFIQRAASGAATTGALALAPTITAEFQAALAPLSAFAQLRALGSAFTLDVFDRIIAPR